MTVWKHPVLHEDKLLLVLVVSWGELKCIMNY